MMSDLKFYHIGIAETIRHWTSLQEDDRIPQIFRSHFMSQQIDSTTSCNEHEPFLGPIQYVGTSSLSTGNLTGRNIASGKDLYGLGRWSWKKLRGQRKASPRISTFYRIGGGPSSVYSQHLTYYNSTNMRICQRQGFLKDLK